jgi:bacterioferritin-associated ferredoxin
MNNAIANHSHSRYILFKDEGAGMILCVCNALREADVRAAVRDGATCAKSAYRALGSKPKCGQCVPAARTVVSEERNAA